MKSYLNPAFYCLAATALTAEAALIQTPTTNGAMNGFTVSNSDLLQQGGVVTTVTGFTVWNASGGLPNPVLTDGSAGGNTTNSSDYPNWVLMIAGGTENPNQWSVTYDLDLGSAAFGYDITDINTYSGWVDVRASQKHEIYYSLVGDAGYTLLTSVAQPASNQGLKYAITDGTGIIASGVDSIRFVMDSGGAGGHVYRELDVIGVASVPEPSVLVLGTLGLMSLARRRRV